MNSTTDQSGRASISIATVPRSGSASRKLQRTIATVVWALLAVLLVPVASAQRLDDVWFKLRFTGKGHTLDDAGNVEKVTITTPVYMHFTSIGAHRYVAQIWTRTDSGWSNMTTSEVETLGVNENIISDWGGTLHGPEGSSVHVYCTFFVSVKTNPMGDVVSGVFDGGGEIDDGMLALVDGGAVQYNHYYGTCTVKGTVVKSSKLPFSP